MLPPLPLLENYQVSAENGFLPSEPPLQQLPDPYYEPWELLLTNLQTLLFTKQLRRAVQTLPLLTTSGLRTDAEWRRAYMILGFISNSYIWGHDQDVKDRVPKTISIPFLQIAEHLEIPPVVTYAGLCLWNFKPIRPYDPIDVLENLDTLSTFTGSLDESWFYLVSVAIEARGAPTIPLMLEAMAAARRNDPETVTERLAAFAGRVMDLRALLGRMYDHCSPKAFYYRIRPFLAGSKNMAEAGLPKGVILETGRPEDDVYRQYSGGSNAQSSLIQFFDIALGVVHRPTGVKKDPMEDLKPGSAPPNRHNFIEEMRSYMPGPHRRFLEHLITVANIRDFVETHEEIPALRAAYDECLRALASFRDKHLQIVSRYVVIMSQESRRRNGPRPSTPVVGVAKAGLTGTGGTKLMPFLKQSRDETMESATNGAWGGYKTPPSAYPNPNKGFAPGFARSCRVGDFEDLSAPRVTGVGMAGVWEAGDDVGGICHY